MKRIEGTRLTLIREYSDYPRPTSKKRTKMWEVRCDCGKVFSRTKSEIVSGHTKSCGCLARDILLERNYRHGLRHEACATTFYSMHRRCEDPNHRSYDNYGGRGITVCEEWNDIANFVAWCKANGYRKGLQLDRIDNDKGYSPDNCRFVTVKENLTNRRNTVRKDGMMLKDWLEHLSQQTGIKVTTLHSRYYYLKRAGYIDEDITAAALINYQRKARQSITTSNEKS